MSEFTASNGIPVIPEEHGGFQFVSGIAQMGTITGITAGQAEALREFFVKENDDRLGRWRWSENPDYVVYRAGEMDGREVVNVVRESDGAKGTWTRADSHLPGNFSAAARAFFDAHPEPKPWHDAKPNDVYVVTWPGSGIREPVVVPSTGWPRAWECATSAERILDWAEVQS